MSDVNTFGASTEQSNMSGASISGARRVVAAISCPSCWHEFPCEQVLFISKSTAPLELGDFKLGPTSRRRFRAGAYTLGGEAVDPSGTPTSDIACPRCHLEMSRALLYKRPLQISIVGAQQCGKSYLLATMVRELRNRSNRFGFSFRDAHTRLNQAVIEYEETLFFQSNPNDFVRIRKTEQNAAKLHRTVLIGEREYDYPIPFQFHLERNGSGDPKDGPADGRVLVLYDNAGEHFQPGQDRDGLPVTRHLSRSKAVFFVFDPTQDPRVVRDLDVDPSEGASAESRTIPRQDVIFNEMAERIRRDRQLVPTQRVEIPLVVILAKADAWASLAGISLEKEPIIESKRGHELDLTVLENVSRACSRFVERYCPDMWSVLHTLSSDIIFIPVSALGHAADLVKREFETFYGVRPSEIRSKWITVPVLWAIRRDAPEILQPAAAEAN